MLWEAVGGATSGENEVRSSYLTGDGKQENRAKKMGGY